MYPVFLTGEDYILAIIPSITQLWQKKGTTTCTAYTILITHCTAHRQVENAYLRKLEGFIGHVRM